MTTDVVVRRAATTVSFVLAVVVVATAATIFWPRLSTAMGIVPAPPPPAYTAGDAVDVPADWYSDNDRTVILVAQAGCGACQRAMPYFTRLIGHLGDRATFIMASPGLQSDYDRQYGHAIGLADEAIRILPRNARARATPTLIVVDRQGTVLGAWEGVGPEEQYGTLTNALESAVGRP